MGDIEINARVQSVQKSEMILKKGVIAQNDILSYEEFYSFMKNKLNDQVINRLDERLRSVSAHIKKGRLKSAYSEWEALQRNIFDNKNYAVSLLFIENINSAEGNYNYKYSSKEEEILGNRGKLSRLSQLNEKLFKENIEKQISEHLSSFINDVSTAQLSLNEIDLIFNSNDSEKKKNAAYARWHTGDYSYKNIFFGDNPVWQGNVADAFMNHMAHLHAEILAGNIESENELNLFANSVFQEEKDNVFNMLMDSKNNTSWITGGDIILKYGDQLYNIQLKTGLESQSKRGRNRIGGKLATADLLSLIEELRIDIKNSELNKLIDKLYAGLETSGWVEKTNTAVGEIINKTFSSFFNP